MRCEARARKSGLMGFISVMNDQPGSVQCREQAGHDGKHHASYCPFPGFADEHVWWTEGGQS